MEGTILNVVFVTLGRHRLLILIRRLIAKAGQEGRNMNLAVAYLTLCNEKFTDAKPFAEACGGAYLQNFNAKFQEAQ